MPMVLVGIGTGGIGAQVGPAAIGTFSFLGGSDPGVAHTPAVIQVIGEIATAIGFVMTYRIETEHVVQAFE
ncbi:hypothetical protein D3C86_2228240 [compost metagenome]